MHRPAAPRRRLALASVVTVLALAATGCNAGRPPAATVNGHEISAALLFDFTEAYASIEKVQPGQSSAVLGQGEGTFATDVTATILSFLVERQIILTEGRRRKLTPTAAQRTKAKTDLYGSLSSDAAEGKKAFERMTKETQDFLVESTAMSGAVQAKVAKPTDPVAQARATFDANEASFARVCVNTITTADEAGMAVVQSRIAAGEAFTAVAKELSVDEAKAKGGDRGCTPLAFINQTIATELAPAKDGAVVGPFGTIIVLVRGHQPADFDSVKDELVQQIKANGGATGTGEAELAALETKLLKAAEVSVDPRFGRWSKAVTAVLPPKAPAPASTTTTKPARAGS